MLPTAYLVFTDPSVIIPGQIRTILINIGFVLIEHYIYKDPLWRKILSAIAIYFAVASGELTLLLTKKVFDPEIIKLMDHTMREFMLVTGIASCTSWDEIIQRQPEERILPTRQIMV